ncbi:ABC transporter permease [Tistrella mobilis]|uniref:Branched-chain amino acid ABC transporter n=1 Tax=Tistrella mobilis (strain KA081020-065) TaxID=1110502 RepID=I3TWA4_TISMK|nr:ABC transporter permease [Tistrella mobilis]AFK57042.1 branched-chain amino acid ABC transporter [Tistrella mobilis KA081020-065]
MDLILAQFLTGLASASSLFLAASGLSIIFGVTRIVNFAHGAFYMLGAYLAWTFAGLWAGALGWWAAILAAAAVTAALGAITEIVLLRRLYRVPELFQLLATFGLTLAVQDIVVLIWGPEDLVGPRAPGLDGAVTIMGQALPVYDVVLIAAGPIVLAGLFLIFRRTRFGILVRAATQDRDMVAALGVDQRLLFTGVFALGVFLAGLGGALQLPRAAVSHAMDLGIIVEIFVVVVIGGLGSITGAFLAAVIVSELNAFGILVLPEISLVIAFLVMAVVLVVRPQGLLGRAEAPARGAAAGFVRKPWAPWPVPVRAAVIAGLVVLLAGLPVVTGGYVLGVAAEIAIFALFAQSLQFLMSTAGVVSFGHAAYFGLGAYGTALAATGFGLAMGPAAAAGVALAGAGAVVFGWFCVRLSGVYLAMLTLAFAQIAWSIAFQWVSVTGGDNGILGVWPPRAVSDPAAFFRLAAVVAIAGVALLRMITFAPFGQALRALADAPRRAEAIGLDRRRMQWAAFVVAGVMAGLAGVLHAYLKGSVFPDVLAIPLSVDALAMVLLGGVETVSGAVLGAGVFRGLSIWLTASTDLSKLVLGLLIVVVAALVPRGLGGLPALLPRRHGR